MTLAGFCSLADLLLRSLLDKYTIVSSFEDTPAFLTLPAAADSDE
jgi:hypothetical protein